jgi:hypothetical protein
VLYTTCDVYLIAVYTIHTHTLLGLAWPKHDEEYVLNDAREQSKEVDDVDEWVVQHYPVHGPQDAVQDLRGGSNTKVSKGISF